MTNNRQDQGPPPAGGHQPPPYLLHKDLAAVARAECDGVVAEFEAAGFGRDGIDVYTAKDVPDLAQPVGGTGVGGFPRRLGLSTGGDLDGIHAAQRELGSCHTLIVVLVDGDAERDRAHAIPRKHGGHSMKYFGKWTITTREGDAHRS